MAKKLLAIGDSLVYGRIAPQFSGWEIGGWVNRLRRWYVSYDPDPNSVFNCGIGGDTTRRVLARFEVECTARAVDVILLSVGVNDGRRDNAPDAPPQVPPEEFRANLETLLALGKRLAPVVIFVSMVPVDETRTIPLSIYYVTLAQQQIYHAITREVCAAHGVAYLDLFSEWLALGPDYPRLLADGLHPNAEGYERMFQSVKDALLSRNLL